MSDIESAPEEVRRAPPGWHEGTAKSVTMVVTEDCQLRCSYCYVTGKNRLRRMSREVARGTIDYLLAGSDHIDTPALILEFIGGEPLLAIDLIDDATDYFKLRAYELDHPWFERYRISISTNGILYGDERVQRYIAKNHAHLSIGISLDGTKRKHDMNRVYPGGRGSYDDIMRNVPLWLSQYPGGSSKVTISSEDIPYIRESVLHLFSLGITDVNINVVFEDVWKPGDDERFEEQLRELADEIVDGELYRGHTCSLFNASIGNPIPANEETNWCGSGKNMLAVDTAGDFYPCNRFLPFTLNHHEGRRIGNYRDGIDPNRLRPFYSLTRSSQSTDECMRCDVAGGCAWCVGFNYDEAPTPTIFHRSTAICRMHLARVRANRYYQERLRAATQGRAEAVGAGGGA